MSEQARKAEILARRAAHLAVKPEPPATGQTIHLMAFAMAGEMYGLDVKYVREIYPLPTLTPVPRTPDFVAGVFNARGRVLSVLDLHCFLGMPGLTPTPDTRIILITDGGEPPLEMGILADEVPGLYTVFQHEIEPPLPTHTTRQADYVRGTTREGLTILNMEKITADKRLLIHEEI